MFRPFSFKSEMCKQIFYCVQEQTSIAQVSTDRRPHLSVVSVSETLLPVDQPPSVPLSLCLGLGSVMPPLAGDTLICRDKDSMLRCSPERRGQSEGEPPALPPRPTVALEKHSEELTLRMGAGLGVRQLVLLIPDSSCNLEKGGTLGGSRSSTSTIPQSRLLELTLSR